MRIRLQYELSNQNDSVLAENIDATITLCMGRRLSVDQRKMRVTGLAVALAIISGASVI